LYAKILGFKKYCEKCLRTEKLVDAYVLMVVDATSLPIELCFNELGN
jgi:hypothetical protein